jgi:two-component system chemotaxis response regulator CheB
MIKLLIIDDSFFVRQVVKKMVSEDPDIRVIGEACNGKEGIEKIRELSPDVICLDLVMPVQDGVVTVEKIITERLTPAVIFSSLSSPLSEVSKSLYDMGLLHLLQKPTKPEEFTKVKNDLICSIKAAAKLEPAATNINYQSVLSNRPENNDDLGKLLIIACPGPKPVYLDEFLLLIINVQCPIIVQMFLHSGLDQEWIKNHQQTGFWSVKFAEDGDLLTRSRLLFSPNCAALEIVRFKQNAAVQLHDAKTLAKQPLDMLFTSAAQAYKQNAVVVILPGLSASDGLEAMKTVRKYGGKVLVHNEQALIKKITNEQLADKILPTESLAWEVLSLING